MESIISTFHIDWKIIVAQAVNFGVVMVVLYFFALKPLSKLMNERSEKIKKGVEDAKISAETLAATKQECEKVLSEARIEAGRIFEESKKEAEAKKVAMLEEAKAQVAGVVEGGKKTLEAEKTKMVSEAKKEIANLAILATEKILGTQKISVDEKTLREISTL